MKLLPFNFNPPFGEEIFQKTQYIILATLFGQRASHRSTAVKELSWVLDELAIPGTVAAIRQIRRRTGTKNGETRARSIGDSKWSSREVDRVIGKGKKVKRGAVGHSGCS